MITNLEDIGKDFKTLAIEKINKELNEFHGDSYGSAVSTYVANVLRDFCEQDERFAEVVYKTKRSLSDCCAKIMRGCGKHISDIEVYRRATKMYFPDSEVNCVITIITGELPEDKYISKEPPKKKASKKDSAAKAKQDKPAKESPKKAEEAEVIQLTLF